MNIEKNSHMQEPKWVYTQWITLFTQPFPKSPDFLEQELVLLLFSQSTAQRSNKAIFNIRRSNMSKLQRKLQLAAEQLPPETKILTLERKAEREVRIPAGLKESFERNEAHYKREKLREMEEREAWIDMINRHGREQVEQSREMALVEGQVQARRSAKVTILKFGAASGDKLTFHAAQRMTERRIGIIDVLERKAAVISKRSHLGQEVIITTWRRENHDNSAATN